MLNINDVVALEKIKNPNSYFKSKIYGRDKTRKAYFVIRSISEEKMELLPVEDLDNIYLSKKQNEYESLKQDIRDLDKAIACFVYPRLVLFKERILKNDDPDYKDLLEDLDTMIIGFGLLLNEEYIVEISKKQIKELTNILNINDANFDSAFYAFKDEAKILAFKKLAERCNDLWS